jgi:hypothetical protein
MARKKPRKVDVADVAMASPNVVTTPGGVK